MEIKTHPDTAPSRNGFSLEQTSKYIIDRIPTRFFPTAIKDISNFEVFPLKSPVAKVVRLVGWQGKYDDRQDSRESLVSEVMIDPKNGQLTLISMRLAWIESGTLIVAEYQDLKGDYSFVEPTRFVVPARREGEEDVVGEAQDAQTIPVAVDLVRLGVSINPQDPKLLEESGITIESPHEVDSNYVLITKAMKNRIPKESVISYTMRRQIREGQVFSGPVMPKEAASLSGVYCSFNTDLMEREKWVKQIDTDRRERPDYTDPFYRVLKVFPDSHIAAFLVPARLSR